MSKQNPLWMKLVNAESNSGDFEFMNRTGEDSPIELQRVNEDGSLVSSIYMTYEQWEELCRFVKRLAR